MDSPFVRRTRLWTGLAATLIAVLAFAISQIGPANAQQDDDGDVLRIGWVDGPETLNPFVAQDTLAATIHSKNWDYLVNFSAEDNTPVPGIAESWKVSSDRRSVTFRLRADDEWSDGQPITSADVKYSLEVLGRNGVIFGSYVDNLRAVETPDRRTVIVRTRIPDARVVGGLLVPIVPAHAWREHSVKELTGSFTPDLPLVGSGPWVVTKFEQSKLVELERNPRFRGERPDYEKLQFIAYASQDAVSRALELGEIDVAAQISTGSFERLGGSDDVDAISGVGPYIRVLSFNLCTESRCPDRKVNPAIQDAAVRRAIAYSVDRQRLTLIATSGTSPVAHGVLPTYYKAWYRRPRLDYGVDTARANRLLDRAGYTERSDGVRSNGEAKLSFELLVSTDPPVDAQIARLIKEQAARVGIEFRVTAASFNTVVELTSTHTVDGKPAPEFDTYIGGWSGDPYDPSGLLLTLRSDEIGNLSDSYYAEPAYDRLFDEQAGETDQTRRRRLIQQMVGLVQRDLPWLVLDYPTDLQAFRTDRVSQLEPASPKPDGPVVPTFGYEALIDADPVGKDDGDAGVSLALIAGAGVLLAGGIYLLIRRRRRRVEPLEH